MTTTWNANKPAVGNTIAADIPDIQENFLLIKDILEAITNGTLGTTVAANFDVDVLADGADCGTAPTMTSPVVTTGFNDGTQAISWPTNGMAAAKFMLGNSNTIVWFYLNTAPPGWKVLATGADTVLGVAGGAQAYNVDGGTAGGTWTQPDHTLTIDEMPAHTHSIVGGSTGTYIEASGTQAGSGATGSKGGGGAHNHGTTYRVSASVGKLFQLDTA